MSQKFVVLFGGVGSFGKGDVVEGGNLGSDSAIKRLLDLKAIRLAEPHEAKQPKVEVIDKADTHASYETRLIEKDQKIADLKVKIAEMEAEIQALKAAIEPKKPEPIPQTAMDLIAEKEKQIKALQAEKGKK